MEFTRRDLAILAGFSLLLTAGVALFINSQRGPGVDSVARPTERRGARDAGPADEALATRESSDFLRSAQASATVPVGYQAIVERKLFEPLVKPPKPAPRGGPVTPREIPPPALTLPPLPPPALAERTVKPPPEQPATKPETPPSAPAPAKPPIAVTGLMRFGDGYRVLLENPERKQSRTVKVGGEAFGYRVTEVDEEAGTVTVSAEEGPANVVRLKLGDKPKVEEKQETKAEASPGASSPTNERASSPGGATPTTASPRRGFDPNSLTPEQRQRYEEWQRRRGGGGRGG